MDIKTISPDQITTADELAKLASGSHRYELVEGTLMVREPAGGTHGYVASEIGRLLANRVREARLGKVFAAETGFKLRSDPDTVRAPDAAFVSGDRLAALGTLEGYLPIAPDLAIEVISPNDTATEVEEKVFAWLEAGTRLVLTVTPRTRSITAYRSRTNIRVYLEHEELDASDVVAGWRFHIRDVFA